MAGVVGQGGDGVRLLALWLAGSVPLSVFIGRFIAAGRGPEPDYGDYLRALEEMGRR